MGRLFHHGHFRDIARTIEVDVFRFHLDNPLGPGKFGLQRVVIMHSGNAIYPDTKVTISSFVIKAQEWAFRTKTEVPFLLRSSGSAAPIVEMTVTAITGRVLFHDIAYGMCPSKMLQHDFSIAWKNRHLIRECGCGPGWAGDAFIAFKQTRKALELTVANFLSAFCNHGARCIQHQDLHRAPKADAPNTRAAW